MALIKVEFEWDDSHGECYDCGLPAAFTIIDIKENGSRHIGQLLCSVCAANAAANGEYISKIDKD